MNIIDQLRRDEGEVLHAYLDSLGYWTIGIGVLIDQRKGGGITADESAMLLANRLALKRQALIERFPPFVGLDDARQGALLNMAYQLGVDGLMGFPAMLKAVAEQRWQDAHDEALASIWAKQTPERAQRVADQLLTGEWQ